MVHLNILNRCNFFLIKQITCMFCYILKILTKKCFQSLQASYSNFLQEVGLYQKLLKKIAKTWPLSTKKKK